MKGSLIGLISLSILEGWIVAEISDCGEAATVCQSLVCTCRVFVEPGFACGAANRALAIIEETQALKSKAANKARNVIIRRKGVFFMVAAPLQFLELGC